MTRPTARLSRRFVPSVLILTLAGCSGLLGGGEPAHLYRLTPKSTYPPNLPHRTVQLLVDEPLAPAGLDKSRIALSRSPVSIDYFADSEWTDRAPLLVQTAILQSFENSRAVTAIDRESVGLRADFILKTDMTYKGTLPLNTSGGQISAGQPGLAGGGLNLVEAVRQLFGEAGERQVADVKNAMVTGIGVIPYARNWGVSNVMILES